MIVIKNCLKDRIGDEINALSACCAFNKKKRLNHMRAFCLFFTLRKKSAETDGFCGLLVGCKVL